MTMRRCWLILLLCLVPVAQAATVHAFFDRNHVSLGDTVTLNIESDGPIDTPDLSPLRQDFEVLGTSRSSKVQIANGKASRTSQIGIALKPLHAGTLMVPALDVGGAATQPLTLQVAAAPSGGKGKVGDPVFMQTGVLSSSPYVGQQTVYTVRLFYQPGVHGTLGDPHADGARLIPLGDVHRSMARRDGYAYKVVERRWALIPGRSGTIEVHGPMFQGESLGSGNLQSLLNDPKSLLNNPNALLNGPFPGFGTPVQAAAPSLRIEARAAPARAGKPWLPARDVTLKLTGLPADGEARVGVPVTVTLAISATGIPGDALPEPELPPIAGARIYPDKLRDTTGDAGQWLEGTRTRSFAIVPERNGTLEIPAITLNWWDVVHDRAEQVRLPAHTLEVTGAAMAGPGSTAPPSVGAAMPGKPGMGSTPATDAIESDVPGALPSWRIIALASIALWLLVIVVAAGWWWLRRRASGTGAREDVGTVSSGGSAVEAGASIAVEAPAAGAPVAAVATTPNPRALQRKALDAARAGDAADCEHALLAWARVSHPQITSIGALREQLADPAQRDALATLQRARWHGGNAKSACAGAAAAFKPGFTWREPNDRSGKQSGSALPPLYPPS